MNDSPAEPTTDRTPPIELKKREEIAQGERPTVSLHLLVKNGQSCVGRLLENVGPYIDEIVAVVNDTTDRTEAILREYAESRRRQQPDFNLEIVPVTSKTHPEFYMLDVAETYQTGKSLIGEPYSGPFTGRMLLSNWAAVRNLGWEKATKDWRLFLDADDVVADPECIPGLCLELQSRGVELACSRYVYAACRDGGSLSDSYRERLAVNKPHISWVGITHEVLKGAVLTAHIDGNLKVRDMKDSAGEGIRLPGRCFKILYQNARANDWMVSPRNLVYLAMEAKLLMPELAAAVLELYLTRSSWPEERAWACSMRGEICEAKKENEAASQWFSRSLQEHPGSKSAFRLCRSRFAEGKWEEAIEAYHLGVKNKAVPQILDSGPLYEELSKILLAVAYDKLERYDESRAVCSEALKVFPHNSALKMLRDYLLKKI